ncbi:hypothetical protein C0991_010059 [Blastosporella zonata]|nr:hypothetical protein C0991_010059 [Blastosporella zonata]
MVLQSNFFKHTITNAESTPPSVLPKSFASRLLTTRRARANSPANSSKYAATQAARRSCKQKQPIRGLKFKVLSIPTPDVEMADITPSSSSRTVPVVLPKELGRPDFREVSRQALMAAASDFKDASPQFIRDGLQAFGLGSFQSLTCVRPEHVPEQLQSEIEVRLQAINGFSPVNPTHMLAVFGPPLSSASSRPAMKRKVTLYPAHSTYLAAYCARLPPFAPSPASERGVAPGTPFKIPVRALCIPSPATYARLSAFLYTKDAETLLAGLLPTPPTSPLISTSSYAQHRKNVSSYVYRIASTYTTQVLLQHAVLVHGLWQNTCALGIFDDGLWEVIDVAWMVLLAAIAIGTGSSIDTVLGEEEDS